ncbi:TPR repeat region-containing protein [Nocardiopsis quinghaiensis]|uniref:TPR repeat region-containing protein n=1 Tax=Nocardiopsis quinghaiensis TaxID=464995 RepID=UPI00123AF048|nr:hypothetical protein [Nocardiopsis quinghaiensis]
MYTLSYTECEIDTGALSSHAETFQELHTKISGRSGEFSTIAEPVATHFEGLVGESLKSVATENQEAWSSAMMACIHAYGIIQKVISDVEWYENEIETIKADLATALGSSPSTGNEVDDASIRSAVVVRHNERATEAWEKLEGKCETTEERLREGPTPENIKELIEAGHLGGDIAYYTTGDVDYFYFDESDAATMADLFDSAASGNGGALNSLDGQLALLNALVLKALDAQKNGEKLDQNEIDFLEELFSEMEEKGGYVEGENGGTSSQGFLDFLGLLNESEHIDDQTKNDINRNMANSMLFLSDESIGGGMEYLPQDVIDTVVGPMPGASFYPEALDWKDNYILLSEFLGSSGPSIIGGTEFSVELASSSARMLEHVGGKLEEYHFENMIDVASKNNDANYILITGVYPDGAPYEMHEANQSIAPEVFFEKMYSHEWGDEGESISRFTDWIATVREYGSPEEVEMAGKAAHRFISMLAGTEGEDNLFFGTGEKVEGNENVSVAELNSSLADGFADIYISFIDDFTLDHNQDGYQEIFNHKPGSLPFHAPGDDVLLIPADVREKFMQLLVANEEVSPRVLVATEAQEWRIIEETFKNPGVGAQASGTTAGDLREMMTNAIIQEHLDREEEITKARESAQEKWETAYGIFSSLITDRISGGPVTSVATEALVEVLNTKYTEFAEARIQESIPSSYLLEDKNGEATAAGDFILHDPQSETDHTTLQMANVFLEMGIIDTETLREERLLIMDAQGNERLPVTTQEWDGAAAKIGSLADILHAASVDGEPLKGDVMEYIASYEGSYAPNLYKSNLEEE